MESKQTSVSCFHMFHYASSWDIILLSIGVSSCMLAATILPMFIVLFSRLTEVFIDYEIASGEGSSENTFPVDDFISAVEKFGLASGVLGLVQLILCYIMIICMSTSARQQVYRIRTLYIRSLLHQDMAWFDTYKGDFVTQAGESLIKLEDGMGQKLALFIYLICGSLFTLILALYHGWELTLVILLVTLLLIILTIIFSKVQSRFVKKELAAYSVATTLAEESISAIKTVVAFGGEKKIVNWYEEKLTVASSAGKYKGFFRAVSTAIEWALDFVVYSLAFWYGIGLIIESREDGTNAYNPGVLLIVFFCAMTTAILFGQSATFLGEVNAARTVAVPIFQIIERKPAIDSRVSTGLDPKVLVGTIEFRNVHFAYPARRDVPILRGLSLKFNRGETVALVGSSGCGKSTILQLILRLYEPDKGDVLVDGKNVKLYNVCSLRTKMGYVGQEPALFGFSITDNIALAKEGKASNSEIEKAAIAANAHDFITKLPEKYNTLVGDKGAQLSGGQKQRIAIARGLVKNPTILLLDEATSALDNQTEAIVQAALDSRRQNRTTIIVAHRLSSVRNADRIIVLDRGKVMEVGNHESLMAKHGMYYNLVQSQVVADMEDADFDEEVEIEKMSKLLQSDMRVSVIAKPQSLSEEFYSSSPVFLRILALNKSDWWLLLIGGLAAFGFGVTVPMYSYLFGDIMGILAITDPDKAREQTNLYAIYFLLVAIWSAICSFCQVFTFSIAGEYLVLKLRIMTLEAILRQDLAFFDNPNNSVGVLGARLSTDITNIQGATGANIGIFIQAIAAMGLSFIIALFIIWKQALVTAIMIPLICVGTYLEAKFTAGELLHEMKIHENASKIAVEAVANIKTIAALCKEDVFYEKYIESLKSLRRKSALKFHWRGILFGFSQTVQFCWSYGLSLWYGGYLIKDEGYSYSDVLKVAELLIFASVFVGGTLVFAPNCQRGMISARRVFAILDRQPRIEGTFEDLKEFQPPKNSRVEFSHVSFSYPRRPVRILRDFNCVVETGKTVALVGSSGSGKTSCIQLLERFYDIDAGSLKIANQDIRSYDLSWLRSQLGLVSQEAVLFDRSIADNIAFGDSSRTVSLQEIIAVARKANVHSFIINLPQGYETSLGRQGTQLSGGQKQRIAIARALIRNPKILLLDEATSALDAESEKVVQAALDEAMAGRTCIMIAHRLVTVQNADKIVVMHLGRVVEEGSHQELMTKRGVYYQMILLSSM